VIYVRTISGLSISKRVYGSCLVWTEVAVLLDVNRFSNMRDSVDFARFSAFLY
jgi:hypothetical protein